MENFNVTIATFLDLLKAYTGANPTFEIDYRNEKIIVKDCSSGFIKLIADNKKALLHLSKDGLSFQLFL